MKKNPYSELLGIMNGVGKNNQSPVIQIGTILEPPPNIKVRYKSIILEAAECYISEISADSIQEISRREHQNNH